MAVDVDRLRRTPIRFEEHGDAGVKIRIRWAGLGGGAQQRPGAFVLLQLGVGEAEIAGRVRALVVCLEVARCSRSGAGGATWDGVIGPRGVTSAGGLELRHVAGDAVLA